MKDVLVQKFGDKHEMYIHTDDCKPFSCQICSLKDCAQRQMKFVGSIEWTPKLISEDQRHDIRDLEEQRIERFEHIAP